MYELDLEASLTIVHKSEGGSWGEGVLHDHNLVVKLTVAYEYDSGQSPLPFGRVASMLDEELDEYRNAILNNLPQFRGTHVLFEDLARVIHARMREVTMPQGMRVSQVEIQDTRGGVRIRYRPDAVVDD